MYEYRVIPIRVIDGDTVIVDVDLGFHIRQQLSVRLYGINTPERGHPQWAAAREALANILFAESTISVTAKTHKVGDKYGRWLAELRVTKSNGESYSVSDALLQAGVAESYMVRGNV